MLNHRIVCVGVNFRTAPVEYREKLGSDLPELCERVGARTHAASNGDGESIRELDAVARGEPCELEVEPPIEQMRHKAEMIRRLEIANADG